MSLSFWHPYAEEEDRSSSEKRPPHKGAKHLNLCLLIDSFAPAQGTTDPCFQSRGEGGFPEESPVKDEQGLLGTDFASVYVQPCKEGNSGAEQRMIEDVSSCDNNYKI